MFTFVFRTFIWQHEIIIQYIIFFSCFFCLFIIKNFIRLVISLEKNLLRFQLLIRGNIFRRFSSTFMCTSSCRCIFILNFLIIWNLNILNCRLRVCGNIRKIWNLLLFYQLRIFATVDLWIWKLRLLRLYAFYHQLLLS